MAQTSRTPAASGRTPKRPVKDGAAAKQAGQFPTVGMTLGGYYGEARGGRRGVVVRQSRMQRLRQRITPKKAAILIVIILVVLGGWLGGKFLYNIHRIFGGNIFGILSATKLKGEDTGRVNILLAGNSSDDVGHDGAQLTDSIMLVSIDTRHNKAFMLSIPRDLWVHIPGNGHAKINEAYVDGQNKQFDQSGYPQGGMGLLEKVVGDNFGINIDYYALVNYQAVKDTVDAVGGVDFTVQSSDPRGLYDPSIDYSTHGPLVRLTNGVHHLNGEQALDLSRARGDAYGAYGFPQSDFNRTEHQRQLLVDLKNKAVTAGVLANPAKLSSLSDALGKNVHTDMSVSEVKRLYDLTKNINSNNIQSLSLNSANGKDLLTNYAAPGGESALIPALGVDQFYDIQSFIKQQTSSNPVIQEGAHVAVLNATTTAGLASKERTRLRSKSINVDAVGDAQAGSPATTTIIVVNPGKKPATQAALSQLYPGSTVTSVNPYTGMYAGDDFIIAVGADRATPAAGSSAAPSSAQ